MSNDAAVDFDRTPSAPSSAPSALAAVFPNSAASVFFSTAPNFPDAMPLQAINAEVSRLAKLWPRMPNVSVVASPNDLPFESPENADGAYCDGRVFVVAGNIKDIRQLQKVMAHECILHHSLEEMLGDYGFSKLHNGIQNLKKNGDVTVMSLADNIRRRYGALTAEIETKEIVARAGEICLDDTGQIRVEFGFMKAVYAGMTSWLRDHGIKVPFSNVELQGIIHNASEWIKIASNGPTVSRTLMASTAGTQPQDPMSKSSLSAHNLSLGPEILPVSQGTYFGKIVALSNGKVTQKTGRFSETVIHSVEQLSEKVAVGEIVQINYEAGAGIISGRALVSGVVR